MDSRNDNTEQHEGKRNDGAEKSKRFQGSTRAKQRSGNDSSVFKGEYEAMNGHVFQTKDESKVTLQFIKTSKELMRYSVKKFKHPDDIVQLIMDLKETKFTLPDTPPKKSNGKIGRGHKLLHTEKIKRYLEREQVYEDNKKKLFLVVWDQCSRSMQSKLEALEKFPKIKKKRNVVKLLKNIKGIMYDFDETEFIATSLNSAIMGIYSCKQGNTESCQNYMARFRNNLEVLQYYEGDFGNHLGLIKKEMEIAHVTYDGTRHGPGEAEYELYAENAYKRATADLFLRNADPERFRKLQLEIANDFVLRDKIPPKDIETVHTLMVNFKVAEEKVKSNRGQRKKRNLNDREAENPQDSEATRRFKEQMTFATIPFADLICKYCKEH